MILLIGVEESPLAVPYADTCLVSISDWFERRQLMTIHISPQLWQAQCATLSQQIWLHLVITSDESDFLSSSRLTGASVQASEFACVVESGYVCEVGLSVSIDMSPQSWSLTQSLMILDFQIVKPLFQHVETRSLHHHPQSSFLRISHQSKSARAAF